MPQEANVSTVCEKVAESLDSEEDLIIVDTRGHEILDGPGTQG